MSPPGEDIESAPPENVVTAGGPADPDATGAQGAGAATKGDADGSQGADGAGERDPAGGHGDETDPERRPGRGQRQQADTISNNEPASDTTPDEPSPDAEGAPKAGKRPARQGPVPTGCATLDALLDGGLERDAITLVFGEGGSGKTNLALQCARQVTARGRRVAYVDTEGVSARRLEQVFSAEAEADMDRILFFTPYTIAEQEKMVQKTAPLKDIGLIVIDSINMHYRLHIEDKETEKEASTSLFKQLHHLTTHARKHRVPVLVTGQVYGGEDATQPFARRVMEHLVKALVRFEKRPDGSRRATVLKHRSIEEGRQARFRIGAHGLEEA